MNGPSRREDTRSLSLIIGSALVGMLATGVLATLLHTPHPRPSPPRHEEIRVRIEARAAPPASPEAADRLYGRVLTHGGTVHEGFIRWDRNEGSWADVLDALKGDRTAGLRFGHVRSIEPTGARSARVTLKHGGLVDLEGDATDLGTALRALVVERPGLESVRLDWQDLERVVFEPAPAGVRPAGNRLHGTVVTDGGHNFTGYVAWNVEEVYTSDLLEGLDRNGTRAIPFGSIAAILRRDSRSATVVLHDNTRYELRGGHDIGVGNAGITVSDPGLGEVKLDWNELGAVRFHPPRVPTARDAFDGGGTLEGTVVRKDGSSFTGRLVWDRDEAASWEMLDGMDGGIEFQVEFGTIAAVVRTESGARVTLRDGRTLELTGSNDVGPGNRGVLVAGEGWIVDTPWREFAELRLRPLRP